MDKTAEQELKADVRRVFSSLAVVAPFAYPLLMMPIVIRDDISGWAGTNGVTFFVNPVEWMKLTFRQKLFVAMHEWVHVVMMHVKRIQGRRHRAFNYASDFSVNDMIINDMSDHFDAPPGIFFDSDFLYDKTAEENYNIILEAIDNQREQNATPFCNYCGKVFTKDDVMAQPGETRCEACGRPHQVQIEPPEYLTLEDAVFQLMVTDFGTPWGNDLSQMPSTVDGQEMIDAIIKAAARARGMKRGFMPGKYQEYVDKLKKSDIPWERILFRFAREALKGTTDRNPFRPDPKYLPFDIFIPTEKGRRIGKMVFIVDTSASMDKSEFEVACGHLQRLGSVCDKCTVITADTKVQEVVKVKRIKHDLIKNKIKFKGRGGTSMKEAFEVAEKLNPDLIILFSDMEIGDFPPKPRRAQTIFLATPGSYMEESPYGVFIKMNKR